MKWILAVALALGSARPLAGQTLRPIAPGMRIRVHTTTTDGTRSPPVDGFLEQLFTDSLILRSRAGGELQAVPTTRDTRYFIHTGRKNSLLQGTVIGTLTGIITGSAVYAVAGGRSCPDGKSVCAFPKRTVVKGGLIFGLIGASTGLAIGAFSAHDVWRESERDSRISLAAGPGSLGLAIRF